VIQTVKQGLEAEGVTVPMTKLCQWFEVPGRSVYYKPTKSPPKVQELLERPIKTFKNHTLCHNRF
jgi:putative transposase